MKDNKGKAYNAEVQNDSRVLLTPLHKVKDHTFTKVSIVLTDREKYMERSRNRTRQGTLVLDYLLFDIDYNKDTIVIDRKALKKELGMSPRGIVRGIDNLIELGYLSNTSKQSEYLINSDLFFKGIRTPKQKERATNVFQTYNDNRTINVTVNTKEGAKELKDILIKGFGINDNNITIPLSVEGDKQ